MRVQWLIALVPCAVKLGLYRLAPQPGHNPSPPSNGSGDGTDGAPLLSLWELHGAALCSEMGVHFSRCDPRRGD
jgi:hypothetical protein